jgi:hypothetical protein
MLEAPKITIDQVNNGTARCEGGELPFGCVPFVLEGIVDEWPAMKRWNRAELKRRCGDARVECFVQPREQGTFLQQSTRSSRMTFAEFLDHVFAERESAALLHYLRIGTGDPLFEELSADFVIPRLLDGYNAAATGIWIGEKGNVTPFHHDWWHSFLAQVCGRKRYTLVHPFEAPELQKDWPPAARYDLAAAPPAASPGDNNGLPAGFRGVLEPGSVLYIPPFWFHQIDTLDNGTISMPIRFDTIQSPDLPLFQLSQDSGLRAVTNERTEELAELVEALRRNRARFFAREREFVTELIKERRVDATVEGVLARIRGAGGD